MVPLTENLVYKYETGKLPPECPEITGFAPGEGTKEERTQIYQDALAEALNAVKDIEAVEWVNIEWLSADEIAERVVDGWMGSAGHRKNILEKEFAFGGVGIAEVNNYLIITHNLVGR
jgi:hypothetical protein